MLSLCVVLQGWRAPFLELGGDAMFTALDKLGLKYDSSWTTLKYTNWFEDTIPALWPYTLDFPSPQVGGDILLCCDGYACCSVKSYVFCVVSCVI